MLNSLLEDNRSASEEAVWLVADTRKAVCFSEAKEIPYGLDAGAKMKSELVRFIDPIGQKFSAPKLTFQPSGSRYASWKSGSGLSTILVTVPDLPRRSKRLHRVGSR